MGSNSPQIYLVHAKVHSYTGYTGTHLEVLNKGLKLTPTPKKKYYWNKKRYI